MTLALVVAMTAGLAACTVQTKRVAGTCGAAADQTVAEGGGIGPSCEGPPVAAEGAPGYARDPLTRRLYDSGRQGGDIGHSGRAGVYER